jgi:ABC-type multidrug transport system ATPase subunit
MTGREHVELYAAIKGVPRKFVNEAAKKKLAEVGLNDFDSDRLCANYSGGMKRRLSLACAMIGEPQVSFHSCRFDSFSSPILTDIFRLSFLTKQRLA